MSDFSDLHALVDGHLPSSEAAKVREWVKSDPRAQAEFEAISNLKEYVSTHSLRYESEECWKACVVRLNGLDRSRKVEGFVGRYAWALCSIFFASIFVGHYAVRNVKGNDAQFKDLSTVFGAHRHPGNPLSSEQQQQADQMLKRSKLLRAGLHIVAVSRGITQDLPFERFDMADHAGALALFRIHGDLNFEDTTEDPADPTIRVGVITAPDSSAKYANCVVWNWNSTGETRVLVGTRSTQALEALASDLGVR
ncbi:MAG TPA: hypothetical protein VG944_10845 [Fimbriimonas sp.]|nr:hypothetical protein [Fimbriimonas sp.]